MTILRHFRPALGLTLLLMLITGLLYPGAVSVLGQLLFRRQANGSLVTVNGRVVGSELIAQRFTQPFYFHARPSATDYHAAASGGSNKGPTDRALADTLIAQEVAAAHRFDGLPAGQVPADRATRSASGLDPHISLANAEQQVTRVARARSVPRNRVHALVVAHSEGRTFGLLGEPRVNVLKLNIALDGQFGVVQ